MRWRGTHVQYARVLTVVVVRYDVWNGVVGGGQSGAHGSLLFWFPSAKPFVSGGGAKIAFFLSDGLFLTSFGHLPLRAALPCGFILRNRDFILRIRLYVIWEPQFECEGHLRVILLAQRLGRVTVDKGEQFICLYRDAIVSPFSDHLWEFANYLQIHARWQRLIQARPWKGIVWKVRSGKVLWQLRKECRSEDRSMYVRVACWNSAPVKGL